eukprot:g34764.t1
MRSPQLLPLMTSTTSDDITSTTNVTASTADANYVSSINVAHHITTSASTHMTIPIHTPTPETFSTPTPSSSSTPSPSPKPTIPHLFLRNIQDCIGAASCSHEELEQFINFTNTFHPKLKFTWTICDTSLPFMDLCISISDKLPISDEFTCTSSNLVYCIRCSRCGLLYIGETDQFVEHLRSVLYNQQHLPVANYFNSYSLGDMSILGLLQCHNDTTRKL